MYKIITVLLCFVFSIGTTSFCCANDIPEQMLYNRNSRVYFGEIKTFDNSSVTIVQKQNIKGDFIEDREIKYDFYEKYTAGEELEIGRMYLCGDNVIDTDGDVRCAHIFAVTTFDTATLEFVQGCDITDTLRDYFHEGMFERMNEKIRQEKTTENIDIRDDGKDKQKFNLHKMEILLCIIFIYFVSVRRK